jgi:hypothetical protein
VAVLGVLGLPLYLWRNRGRALVLLCVIVLAVMEVSTVVLLTGSLLGDLRLTMVAPLHSFTEIVASTVEVPPEIAQEVAARPETELLLPMLPEVIRVNTLAGPGTRNVFAVPAPFLPWFVARIGERVVQGRLPDGQAAEIALPWQVMRSRHLRLGDEVGQQVDPSEWLPGQWTVVGVLDGTLAAGVAPYEAMRAVLALRDVPGVASYAAFARPGQLDRLNAFLRTLPLAQVRVYTEAAEEQEYQADVRSLNWLIWTVNLVTVGVLALAMGLLQSLYYQQRMEEFGILAAIGYTHGWLARRALAEIAALTVVSWAAGLGLTLVLARSLARWVFLPQGIALPPLTAHDVLFTLPIPAFIAAFTLGTVLRRLRRLDPVGVVERR